MKTIKVPVKAFQQFEMEIQPWQRFVLKRVKKTHLYLKHYGIILVQEKK